MAASAWLIHDVFKEMLGNKFIELDTDTFKIGLATTASTVHGVAIAGYASVTNELTTANGYTAGGYTIVTPAWTRSGSTCTWDCADPVWTASSAGITARYAFIYDDNPTTPTADPIVCTSDLDASSITVTAGNTLTIQMNVSGVFTLA